MAPKKMAQNGSEGQFKVFPVRIFARSGERMPLPAGMLLDSKMIVGGRAHERL